MIWRISWKFDEDRIWFDWGRVSWELGGYWLFLTGDLKDGIIFDIICHFVRCYGRYLKFWSRSEMIWLRKDNLETWKILMVPDRGLEGWGHPWFHRSSWYMIINICPNFNILSWKKCIKNPPSSMLDLEDIDSFWLGTWRMESSLIS